VIDMTDLQMWALVVGFLSPIVLAIINQPTWSAPVKSFVAFVWSAIVAAVTLWLSPNSFDGKNLISTFLLVFVTAVATYRGFWKTSNIAPQIQAATSPKPAVPGAGR